MKVRHTILAAVLMTALLGAVAPSLGVADALPVQNTKYVSKEPVAHPTVVRAKPPVIKTPPRKKRATRAAGRIPTTTSFGQCVINHESRTLGLYVAHNPASSASGAYQFVDGTWAHYQDRAGFGHRYSRAMYAPPAVQDAVFNYAISQGDYYHWKGTHCGHGT